MQKDDVIYKQDALDAIDKRIQFLKDNPVFRRKHGDIDLYGIKPIIRALPPAQLEPRWMPVSERLPNDDKPVLLTEELRFPDGRQKIDVCMASYDSQNRTWYEILGANILEIPHPIAWMPFPDAYQEENKQK